MIVKTVREPDDLVQGTPEDLERLRAQAKDLPLTRILYSLDLLGDTLGRLSRTAFKRTELEMAVVRLCDEQMGGGLEALGERLEKLERAVRTPGSRRARRNRTRRAGRRPEPPRRQRRPRPGHAPRPNSAPKRRRERARFRLSRIGRRCFRSWAGTTARSAAR